MSEVDGEGMEGVGGREVGREVGDRGRGEGGVWEFTLRPDLGNIFLVLEFLHGF